MAVGFASKNPVLARLQVLQAKYPQYHIVLWYSDAGSCFNLLPGTRWIRQQSEAISTGNLLTKFRKGTHHYECYIIIEGAFEYDHKKMTQKDYSTYVVATADFDFDKKQCAMPPKPEFSASCWMSHLDDDLNLKDLTLPGTRCSSASASWINDAGDLDVEPVIDDMKLKSRILEMHKYHKSSISAQLNSGVRLLDLRCDGSRTLRQGPLTLEKQLDNALDHVKTFLEANKSETVIVMLSFSSATAEYDAAKPWSEGYSIKIDDVPGHFNREIKRDMQNDKLLYTGTEWPRLGDVRGQAVIFRGWGLDSDEDGWALDCRLPVWESANGSSSFTKATELATQRWSEIVDDFSSQNSLKSIILAASLNYDPKSDTTWIPPLQTAPILQKKAEEHIKQCAKQLKRLWIYGDDMEEKTNMAIAKLNFWGSDDEGVSRPLPVKFMTT
ncbi:phosphatidylinositol diacylglycerol-lyase (1-phosphatidylinositol phosphodiesterase) [Colletotrichum tofieldiae]|uniref:Phosphatidylinositol diacylglycerol-lyase (1-phosphatidylinositol phosphodiesterase) n=1 Tax=Colletotrichum tofieldiae TaxID=708197 RepID=A0A166VLV3_9PEZI|nr:phosphatidylinositol diacylglycerol-lyase (1-phosphatidylinositol phosphodiesterase) [Colletotrichum tofieldiae]GKT60170.1 phosphatidylinositol diacylglycerol-lyase [Colletotrichum tofieldiae]